MSKKTIQYRSDRCSHTNVVEFDSDEDPWEEKTRGCNSCGTTSQFTKVNGNSDNGGDNSETDSENDVVQDESESEQESVEVDMEVTEDSVIDLEEVGYKQLQSLASDNGIKGNQKKEVLIEELRSLDNWNTRDTDGVNNDE